MKHVAFCDLVSRKWKDEESVDVYIAELKRLAAVAGSEERTVRMVLLNGLPEKVGGQLKTTPGIKQMTLQQVVELARKVMAAATAPLDPGPLPGETVAVVREVESCPCKAGKTGAVATAATSEAAGAAMSGPVKCFYCAEEGHVVRVCPKKRRGRGRGDATGNARAANPGNATGLW